MSVIILILVLFLIGVALIALSAVSVEEGKFYAPIWIISLLFVSLLIGGWMITSNKDLNKVDDAIYPVTFITDNDGQVRPIICVNGEMINVVEKGKINVPVDGQIQVSHYNYSWGINWMMDKEYKVINKK